MSTNLKEQPDRSHFKRYVFPLFHYTFFCRDKLRHDDLRGVTVLFAKGESLLPREQEEEK